MRKQGVLVGPGASAGPAPRGPDSFEHPALPPDGLGLSLWENQGVQPPCSPFTGKQTTPQASNCPRSQPSNCSGGAHNVLDATSAPQEPPPLSAEGQGLRPSPHHCSQGSGAKSFLAIQEDACRLGLGPKPVAISQTLLPGGVTLLGTEQTGWGGVTEGKTKLWGLGSGVCGQDNTLGRSLRLWGGEVTWETGEGRERRGRVGGCSWSYS